MLREIEPGSEDFARFVAALEAASLPTDDLVSEPFRYFTVDDQAWGGVSTGPDAMLRSLVVLPDARGQGLGVLVAKRLVEHAREVCAERLWLLTTNASPFFEKLGWRAADRAVAPAAIAHSKQFSELCPASATLMTLTL